MKNKRSDNFDKFANKKKGSAVKEEYRQEKKKAKADSRAAGEAARQRKKDIAKGIAVEPVGNNKKGGFAKKDYVTGPPKYTIPLRAADGFTVNATYDEVYVIIRYKGDPTPITSITTTFS